MTDAIATLREFVRSITALVSASDDERYLIAETRQHLVRLIEHDSWLPEAFAVPHPSRYMQYLLHCDPQERFSVVSFVWKPGHCTPIHNHTVWGVIGVLRGAERCDEFSGVNGYPIATGTSHVMRPGDVDAVSPAIGDWHRVSNALADRTSISIHVYGANIGAVSRHRLDDNGAIQTFISGYDSAMLPNLWDRSTAVRTTGHST